MNFLTETRDSAEHIWVQNACELQISRGSWKRSEPYVATDVLRAQTRQQPPYI